MERLASILMAMCIGITMVSYIPQIIKLIRTKSSDDLSLGSWTLWVLEGFAYLGYAIIQGEFWLLLEETVSCILLLTTLVLTLRYKSSAVKD